MTDNPRIPAPASRLASISPILSPLKNGGGREQQSIFNQPLRNSKGENGRLLRIPSNRCHRALSERHWFRTLPISDEQAVIHRMTARSNIADDLPPNGNNRAGVAF